MTSTMVIYESLSSRISGWHTGVLSVSDMPQQWTDVSSQSLQLVREQQNPSHCLYVSRELVVGGWSSECTSSFTTTKLLSDCPQTDIEHLDINAMPDCNKSQVACDMLSRQKEQEQRCETAVTDRGLWTSNLSKKCKIQTNMHFDSISC